MEARASRLFTSARRILALRLKWADFTAVTAPTEQSCQPKRAVSVRTGTHIKRGWEHKGSIVNGGEKYWEERLELRDISGLGGTLEQWERHGIYESNHSKDSCRTA